MQMKLTFKYAGLSSGLKLDMSPPLSDLESFLGLSWTTHPQNHLQKIMWSSKFFRNHLLPGDVKLTFCLTDLCHKAGMCAEVMSVQTRATVLHEGESGTFSHMKALSTCLFSFS